MFSSLQDYMSGVGRHNLLYFNVFPQAFAQENNNCVVGNEGQRIGGNISRQLASPSGSQSHRHSVNVSPLKKYLALLLCKLSKAGTESQFLHISEGIAHGSSSFRQGIKSDSVSLTPKKKPNHHHSLHLGKIEEEGELWGRHLHKAQGIRDEHKIPLLAEWSTNTQEAKANHNSNNKITLRGRQMTEPLTPILSLAFINGSLLTTAVCVLHCMETDCSKAGQILVHFCLVAIFHAELKSGHMQSLLR